MSDPLYVRAMEWLSMWFLAVAGTAFAAWSLVLVVEAETLYHMTGFFVGAMLVLMQADRNVYYKRFINLARALRDSDYYVIFKRVGWTDYEVIIDPPAGEREAGR